MILRGKFNGAKRITEAWEYPLDIGRGASNTGIGYQNAICQFVYFLQIGMEHLSDSVQRKRTVWTPAQAPGKGLKTTDSGRPGPPEPRKDGGAPGADRHRRNLFRISKVAIYIYTSL